MQMTSSFDKSKPFVAAAVCLLAAVCCLFFLSSTQLGNALASPIPGNECPGIQTNAPRPKFSATVGDIRYGSDSDDTEVFCFLMLLYLSNGCCRWRACVFGGDTHPGPLDGLVFRFHSRLFCLRLLFCILWLIVVGAMHVWRMLRSLGTFWCSGRLRSREEGRG